VEFNIDDKIPPMHLGQLKRGKSDLQGFQPGAIEKKMLGNAPP
jgi:hypothetical protein